MRIACHDYNLFLIKMVILRCYTVNAWTTFTPKINSFYPYLILVYLECLLLLLWNKPIILPLCTEYVTKTVKSLSRWYQTWVKCVFFYALLRLSGVLESMKYFEEVPTPPPGLLGWLCYTRRHLSTENYLNPKLLTRVWRVKRRSDTVVAFPPSLRAASLCTRKHVASPVAPRSVCLSCPFYVGQDGYLWGKSCQNESSVSRRSCHSSQPCW